MVAVTSAVGCGVHERMLTYRQADASTVRALEAAAPVADGLAAAQPDGTVPTDADARAQAEGFGDRANDSTEGGRTPSEGEAGSVDSGATSDDATATMPDDANSVDVDPADARVTDDVGIHDDNAFCPAGREAGACLGDRWLPLTTAMGPTYRFSHTAVWTGTEMIVWGGFSSSPTVASATGASFNPHNPVLWTPLTTTFVPAARGEHTAIWTGTEMIVWGGSTAEGVALDSGGRFDPSKGWSGTSGLNPPAARYGHTAVWTGTEMIVWGGLVEGVPTNTGGRYNPSSNTWIATSIDGAPSARHTHTAVWTGSEMIVWGGNASATLNAPVNTGRRYDPAKDQWLPTSSAGLVGRYAHTAVWTGEEMIVYGGQGTVTGSATDWLGLRDGGRYNPAKNQWVALPTHATRTRHTAVWTGSEMIVWGGVNKEVVVEQGARYMLNSDSWAELPIGASPVGRSRHTAVWTGLEMIVFGGLANGPGTDSGGRYVR